MVLGEKAAAASLDPLVTPNMSLLCRWPAEYLARVQDKRYEMRMDAPEQTAKMTWDIGLIANRDGYKRPKPSRKKR